MLTFLDHHPDRPLPHAASDKRDHPYQHHDQNGRTKNRHENDRNQWNHHRWNILTGAHVIASFVTSIDDDAMFVTKLFLQLPVNSVGEIG
jgi:hypothetical protein